jgi:hypothetical protein
MTVDLLGWYKLPISIGATPGCFGKTVKIEIAGQPGILSTPQLDWTGGEPRVIAPAMPAGILQRINRQNSHLSDLEKHMYWGTGTKWNPNKRIVTTAHLSAVLITFKVGEAELSYSEYLHGRGYPQAPFVDNLFKEVDGWFDALRTWLEVRLDQDLDPEHPLTSVNVPGQGLNLMSDDHGELSLPASAHSINVNISTFDMVTLPLLRRAATQVSLGASPDDAHLLLRDSSAALRRKQYRRAAIDAGSALELTLADFNRTTTRVNWGRRNPTLGVYVLNPTIAASARLPATLFDDVVLVRNAAIHQNQIPTYAEAILAYDKAALIVNRLKPLPI